MRTFSPVLESHLTHCNKEKEKNTYNVSFMMHQNVDFYTNVVRESLELLMAFVFVRPSETRDVLGVT